ncbi:hypothetical protein [Halalkalibacillus halophilus]|uniref:hypothetical protein n=1 Tax=Halalkalibacillus halophilus TaxID=392827 RepID=UPI0003F9E75C|nr:hypothetical protein [Halalkalibacillus halophilus]
MHILIYPCFSKFGFQLVDYFLNSGVKVDGVGRLEEDDEWFYFESIGRNANFKFMDEKEFRTEESYDQAYLLDKNLKVEASHIIYLDSVKSE